MPTKNYRVLLNPASKSAYFAEYIQVAKAELELCFEGCDFLHEKIGTMDFFKVSLSLDQVAKVAEMSSVYGIFEEDGSSWVPMEIIPDFKCHPDFVFGSKFKGKTNELLTQMMVNSVKSLVKVDGGLKILDPMCGRGTTLMWAMAYGIECRGIEKDPRSIEDIERNCKKWHKIHKAGWKFAEGFIGTKNKAGIGRYFQGSSQGSSFKHVIGDSKDCVSLLKGEKFSGIISDLPYGIQHRADSQARNPMGTLQICVPEWIKLLKSGGVMCLSYNTYMPKKKEMVTFLQEQGLTQIPFDATHRVSESILRDIVLFRKP